MLPATPDDLQEFMKKEVKDGHTESEIQDEIIAFYQENIKGRKLREIVEELQTEEDSEIANVNSYAIEKKDIQNAKMLQPSQRKLKAGESINNSATDSLHNKYTKSAAN